MADEQRIATDQDDGNSTGIEITGFAHTERSHLRTLFVDGTFDSATVKFQISIDNTNFFDVVGADAITAKAVMNVEFRAKFVRINVAGAATAAAVDAWLV